MAVLGNLAINARSHFRRLHFKKWERKGEKKRRGEEKKGGYMEQISLFTILLRKRGKRKENWEKVLINSPSHSLSPFNVHLV